MTPSLGWFGKLKTDSAGRIDLKRGALLPLVGLARTLALRVGSPELSTPGRLRAAVAAGRLVEADASLLLRFHATLLDLILRQQLVDLQVGVRPSCRVEIRLLGRRSARRLARDLRRLDEMLLGLQDAVAG